jgi:hypothetical protein
MNSTVRTEQLHLRVHDHELALVHAVAERSGKSASELVRDLVRKEQERLERREARASKR